VNGEHWRARHILVATGGHPLLPQLPGGSSGELEPMFDLAQFPKRLVVVGPATSPANGVDLPRAGCAGDADRARQPILAGLRRRLAPFSPPRWRRRACSSASARRCRASRGRTLVALHDGELLEADTVLYATGRVPNTSGLGLQEAGVAVGPRARSSLTRATRRNVPSIHAVGDVTDRLQLTPSRWPKAMVRSTACSATAITAGLRLHPTAVFTHPSVAPSAGPKARRVNGFAGVRTYLSEFRSLKHTLSGVDERTLMKLVVDNASNRVVGLHMSARRRARSFRALPWR